MAFCAQNKRRERGRLRDCEECGQDESEVNLLRSPFIHGLYCEECCEELSDGEGGKFSDHKWDAVFH